jgi:DMSO/TMAO reductase YedYZ molybdopterin-dependent catalytic subunit
LNAEGFQGYRLKVFGLVENPLELSLADLRALGKEEHITQHDCIQGWSGVAEWGGLPMHKLFELVRPLPSARYVVFHSYGPGEKGGKYYDSDPLDTLRHPQTLLAYEMNYQPLSQGHGAPLRLRLENKLGFKMVKWIEALEFVEDYRTVFKGEGGYHEDTEYYGYRANV